MKKIVGILAGVFALAAVTGTALADPVRYLDETITLGTPPVTSQTFDFDAPPGRAAILTIERLSGQATGTVEFNGQMLAAYQDFKGVGPLTIERSVEFIVPDDAVFSNLLEVNLTGKPGSVVQITATLAPEVSAVIGSAGGFLEITDPNSPIAGAGILIPPGALPTPTEISIVQRDEPLPNPSSSLISAGMVVEFEPSGLSFAVPATIFIPYFAGITDTSTLRLFVQELITQSPTEITPISIDSVRHLTTASVITTFSSFGNFIAPPPGSPIERMSVDNAGNEGNAGSGQEDYFPYSHHGLSISGDGRYVAFASRASNLVANDTNNAVDIFVRDRQNPNSTVRVSVRSDGTEAAGLSDPRYPRVPPAGSWQPSISANGRHVAFISLSPNMVNPPMPAIGRERLYVHDRDADGNGIPDEQQLAGGIRTTYISFRPDGSLNTRTVRSPSISADGRFVAFESNDLLLAPGIDYNSRPDRTRCYPNVSCDYIYDIFVMDRDCDATTPTGPCKNIGLTSEASYDQPGTMRITRISVNYRDQQTDTTKRIPFAGNGAISASGRYVVFRGNRLHVTSVGVNTIYVRDRDVDGNGVYDEPSVGAFVGTATTAIAPGDQANIYPTGRFISFFSTAQLAPNDQNPYYDLYLWDRDPAQDGFDNGDQLALVANVDPNGTPVPGSFGGMYARTSVTDRIGGNGPWVVFATPANGLVPGDTNGVATGDIFVHNANNGMVARANVLIGGGNVIEANQRSWWPFISEDARSITFISEATNLVPNDTNQRSDVFVAPNPLAPVAVVPITLTPMCTTDATLDLIISGTNLDDAGGGFANATLTVNLVGQPPVPPIPLGGPLPPQLTIGYAANGIPFIRGSSFTPLYNGLTIQLTVQNTRGIFGPFVYAFPVIQNPGPLPNGCGGTGAPRLLYTQNPPVTVMSGAIWPAFSVGLFDINGNPIFANSNTILVLNNGTGALGGTLNQSNVSGVTTYNDISYNVVEPITIQVIENPVPLPPGVTVTPTPPWVVNVTAPFVPITLMASCTTDATLDLELSGTNLDDAGGGFANATLTAGLVGQPLPPPIPLNGPLPPQLTIGYNNGIPFMHASSFTPLYNGLSIQFVVQNTRGIFGPFVYAFPVIQNPGPLPNGCGGTGAPRLLFTQNPPATVMSGAIWPPFSVGLFDINGNPIFANSNTILAVTVGTGVLGGTINQSNLTGVTTYNDISYNKVAVGNELITIQVSEDPVPLPPGVTVTPVTWQVTVQ